MYVWWNHYSSTDQITYACVINGRRFAANDILYRHWRWREKEANQSMQYSVFIFMFSRYTQFLKTNFRPFNKKY